MGNAAYRQTIGGNQATVDQELRICMQLDLPKFVLRSKIGNGKFMKSYVMRVDSTQLVVKMYLKLPDEDLQVAAKMLTNLWKTIPCTTYPNLMPYQMWIRSSSKIKTSQTPVYLIRQYFSSNLYDRLSTRPFLNELEKYWIIFQLLKCLEVCHEHDIIHGDIKPENIMCTTSNWVVLTDFSPYKPVMLPDDDLTDFQYYFDEMSRNRCYVAPERFYRQAVDGRYTRPSSSIQTASNSNSSLDTIDTVPSAVQIGVGAKLQSKKREEKQLTSSMDVFSIGCVIAEIMMDGTPLFDLPSMLQYLSASSESLCPQESPKINLTADSGKSSSKNELDDNQFKQLLSRIKSPLMRSVIIDMTVKDPEKRLRASDYLKLLEGHYTATHEETEQTRVIPEYFEDCIYPLYLKLHWNGVTPDDRVMILCENYEDILKSVTGIKDAPGCAFFESIRNNKSQVLSSLSTLGHQFFEVLLPSISPVLKDSTTTKSNSNDDILRRARYERSKSVKAVEDLQNDIQQKYKTANIQELIKKAKLFLSEIEDFDRNHGKNDSIAQALPVLNEEPPPRDDVVSYKNFLIIDQENTERYSYYLF